MKCLKYLLPFLLIAVLFVIINNQTHTPNEVVITHISKHIGCEMEDVRLFAYIPVIAEKSGVDVHYDVIGFSIGDSDLGCVVYSTKNGSVEIDTITTTKKMVKRGDNVYVRNLLIGQHSYYIFLSNNPDLSKIEWCIEKQEPRYIDVTQAPSMTLIRCPDETYSVKYQLLDASGLEI